MHKLLTDKLQQKLYTPLTKEESDHYIGCWYQRSATAFNKSVVVIVSVNKDGSVNYSEKSMKIVESIPTMITDTGGETIPYKIIIADFNILASKSRKGRLVYCNFEGNVVKLWADKYQPYEITTLDQTYAVIEDKWKPGCQTNLGKYNTW